VTTSVTRDTGIIGPTYILPIARRCGLQQAFAPLLNFQVLAVFWQARVVFLTLYHTLQDYETQTEIRRVNPMNQMFPAFLFISSLALHYSMYLEAVGTSQLCQ